MPLKSDLTLPHQKLHPSSISPQTLAFNKTLANLTISGPKWHEVGAETYRQMRWNGETAIPRPVVLEQGEDLMLPSRDVGRRIPVRVFRPDGDAEVRGVFLHVHGGGWVLGGEGYQDHMLHHYSTSTSLLILSIGYRLAPEHPYPSANEDCLDIASHLIDHSRDLFGNGAKLKFIGGDSAGAHLAVLTTFQLLETRPEFTLEGGLVLSYGCYDLSGCLPQAHHFDGALVLDLEGLKRYFEAYLPGKGLDERRDPWISPFYANLNKMKLPPALFVCGTLDVLLDDSIMMATKWAMSGAETILKLYPGAPHGFSFFPVGGTEQTEECLRDIGEFMNDRLAASE